MADHSLTGTHHIDGSECTRTEACPWSMEEFLRSTSLSRFAGQNPKPRPTVTAIVSPRPTVEKLVSRLLDERECFTVEPSASFADVWHVGIFDSAEHIVQEIRYG